MTRIITAKKCPTCGQLVRKITVGFCPDCRKNMGTPEKDSEDNMGYVYRCWDCGKNWQKGQALEAEI